MAESGEPPDASPGPRRRRWLLVAIAGAFVAVATFALALFQPWKLWVDDRVDEAAPAGAVPITVPPVIATAPPSVATATPTTAAIVVSPPSSALATVAPTAATTTSPPMPTGASFIGIDHGTMGTVVLLEDDAGTQFVRLENLETSNGPDLFVYLSTNPPDGAEGQFDDDYVNLGRLQGNVGSSNYTVPAGTDLARYASVVIWCDRFNSAFGAAPFG